jgi:nitroreductase
MDAIELLHSRSSNGKLTEPGPDAETLQLALQAAARAPDHACLKPWRVRFVRDAARERLGELMARAALRANPGLGHEELESTRRKAYRAPLIIVVGAFIRVHPVVPEIEQILAGGAAAHAILLTLHARGYAAIWRTGVFAYDRELKQALGFAVSDVLLGFIYAGTAKARAPSIPRAQPAEFASDWFG